jgi:MFS family permease
MALEKRAGRQDPGPWFTVGLGFVALAVAFSARATLSLMMTTWIRELGWSRGLISGAAAMALVVMAAIAPLAGRLVDLQGPRNVLAAGLALLAAGSFLLASTSSAWVFVIAFAVVAAIGFGLIATHVVATSVERNFEHDTGLAMGIATAGSTAGQFVIVPVIAYVLAVSSWRWSFLLLGLASIAVLAGVLRLFPGGTPRPAAELRAPVPRTTLAQDLKLIAGKPAFHILLWSYVLCGYATTGIVETHFLPYAAFCGFPPLTSAAAYGVLSAVNLGGMVLAGWLTDRTNRPFLLGAIYILRGLAFLLLTHTTGSIDLLFLFAVVFGLVDYSTWPVTASLAASHIGSRVMGLALGLILTGHSIGAALGAYLGGYLFDLSAKYEWVWLSSVGLSVLAGALVLGLSNRPKASRAAA